MTLSKQFLCVAALAVAVCAAPASADVILTFGQTGGGDTITATNNNVGSTTISGTDIAVTITGIDAALVTPIDAFLQLSATNIGPAFLLLGNVVQEFSGSFCISSGLGCTGTDYLSATFTDAVFGAAGGAALTLSAAQPPGSVTFFSDVIADLAVPRAISFSFANVSPAVGIHNGSLSSFESSVSGTFSASKVLKTPEPATLGLLGIAFAGLGLVRRRTRK